MKNRNNIANLSNEELVELFLKEYQPHYFSELYRRYIPMLYGLCLKYLGNTADSQDAVMDLYEDLSQKIEKYTITNFHSWLYTVAKNHCLMKLRREKELFFVEINEAVMENAPFFTLLDKEKSDEDKTALEYCINELNNEQRQCIERFYYEEESYADIVDATGYPLQKVKSYIQNGKRNLKNCISKVLKMDIQL